MEFPFEIFPTVIKQNMFDIAKENNIPTQFMGATALFTLSGLAGNMYRFKVAGDIIKPILFMALIAPSGVGKTPAWRHLGYSPTALLRVRHHEQYLEDAKRWRIQHEKAEEKGEDVPDRPLEIIRMLEEGTSEAIEHLLTYCKAGLTLTYDEGQKFFTTTMQYKKDSSSDGFWNQLFEGQLAHIYRVSEASRRFIPDPCVNVMIGLQTERSMKYFTEDSLYSGTFNRFLFCFSQRFSLAAPTSVDSLKSIKCEEWRSLVRHLFEEGFTFEPMREGGRPGIRWATVAKDAKVDFDFARSSLVTQSNMEISKAKHGDASTFILGYNSKLFKYFSKFCLILAVLRDPVNPIVTKEIVYHSLELYKYFKLQVSGFLNDMVPAIQTGLSVTETAFYDALPDLFDQSHINEVAKNMNVCESFFRKMMQRKLMGKMVKKLPGKANYCKI